MKLLRKVIPATEAAMVPRNVLRDVFMFGSFVEYKFNFLREICSVKYKMQVICLAIRHGDGHKGGHAKGHDAGAFA
ncbi:MAG: hypothetical protein WDN75_18950 [Bacteroidota bacterium]